MNLVVGRACFASGKTRLYAYVHNQVASAATRLDHFLTASGVGHNDRVSIFTDGAGEFEKAVNGASRHRGLLAPNGRDLCEEIASCKWLV